MLSLYSIDLRWRIVLFNLVHGFPSREMADLLCLSERTVRGYITLLHQTGDVKPVSCKSGPPRLLGDLEQLHLFQLILRNPGITCMNYNTGYKKLMVLGSMFPQYAIPSSSWAAQGRYYMLPYNNQHTSSSHTRTTDVLTGVLHCFTFLYYPMQADQYAVGTSIGLLIRLPNVSLRHWSSATEHFMLYFLAISNLFCDNFGCGKAFCHRTIRWSQLPPPVANIVSYCFTAPYRSI